MKRNESFLYLSEVQQTEKNNLDTANTGITRRLLEKYKSKKDFIVIDNSQKDKEFNIAA